MGYLFLDIETFVDEINKKSGLSPFFSESKIISIAFNYYNQFILTDKNIIPPTILKEWESSEEEIIKKFYNFIKNKVQSDPHIKLVGFNLIKFDLPYLLFRIVHYKIDEPKNIYEILFTRPHHIDLAQIGMTTSQRMKIRKEFYNVNQKEINKFFGLPVKEGSGVMLSSYYRNGEYDKITNYIKQEFQFEKLYVLLRRHLHSKRTMEK